MKQLTILFLALGLSFTQPTPQIITPNNLQQLVSHGKCVLQINADWNKLNEFKWVLNPRAKYFYLGMDKYPELKNKMNIKSLPTIIIYENGKEVNRIDGGVLFKINQTQAQILAK